MGEADPHPGRDVPGGQPRLKRVLTRGDLILFGLVMSLKGPSYGLGTLMHMGPGFMPTALGVILILLGIAIAGAAVTAYDPNEDTILPEHREWVGWGCILAGPICFILFGAYLGLAPATFSCVFVSALGDKTATLKSSFVLATVVTIFGVGLFAYFLQVPMPILEWRGF